MNDRPGIETAMFLAAVGLFALFGASSRILYRWEAESRFGLRMLGNLMVSVFTSMLVGFACWDLLADKPMLLTAVMGSAAWLGGDVIDAIAMRVLGEQIKTPSTRGKVRR